MRLNDRWILIKRSSSTTHHVYTRGDIHILITVDERPTCVPTIYSNLLCGEEPPLERSIQVWRTSLSSTDRDRDCVQWSHLAVFIHPPCGVWSVECGVINVVWMVWPKCAQLVSAAECWLKVMTASPSIAMHSYTYQIQSGSLQMTPSQSPKNTTALTNPSMQRNLPPLMPRQTKKKQFITQHH